MIFTETWLSVKTRNPRGTSVALEIMSFQTLLAFAAIWTVAMIVLTAASLVLMSFTIYVLLGSPPRRILTSGRRQSAFNRVAGSFYIVTGLFLAVANMRR